MLHLGRAHDAYADVEEQLGNHAQARRVRRGRGGRSLSAVSFCHHPCLTASVNCANWPNIYICTLDRDCKRHILASVSTWCRYTVISFSSHHRTLQRRKKQICSSSLPIDFQSWVQIHELYSFTIYISNGQCPRLQNCMNIAHDRRLASSGKCLSSFCSQFSDVQRLLLRETKSVPGCLIIFHILCLSTTLAPPKPWPTRCCFSA